MGAYGGLCIGPLLMTGQLTSDNSRTPRRASVNGLLRVRLRPTYSTLHLNDGVLGLGLPHQHLMPGSWRAHVRCSAAPAGRLRCRRRRKEKDTEQGRIERCGAPVWQQTKGGAGLGSAIRQRKLQKLGRQPLPLLRLALSPFALNFGFISDSEPAILFCSRLASSALSVDPIRVQGGTPHPCPYARRQKGTDRGAYASNAAGDGFARCFSNR